MQCTMMLSLLCLVSMPVASATAAKADNPLAAVIELMDELTAKVIKDGDEEQKAYVKYTEWCDDSSRNHQQEITTLTSQKEKLEAKIEELTGTIEECTQKIEDLAAAIASDEKDLKDATLVREKEVADFEEAQAELVETLSALSRAIGILEKEMAKNPAAFTQVDAQHFNSILEGLNAVMDAASFAVADKHKLAALVQEQQSSDDQDPGAPDPAAYKTHSTNILDVLSDMKDKAEEQLSTLRMEETKTKQNFDMLAQSLKDQIANDNKEKKDQEELKSASAEAKATAEEDLANTNKVLAETKASLSDVRSECMSVASDHDATVAGRKEELKVIATAKKILQDTSSGAVEETYDFLQMSSRADLASAEIVTALRQLAKRSNSPALAQLASQVAATFQYGASAGEDPFVKVKGLIKEMIAKLTKLMNAEAAEKAWCDEQMSKTEAKQTELEDDVAKLTSKVDQATAASTTLKDEVAGLQAELASLAKEQSEMDSVRAEQHAAFLDAKADLELGLKGVRKALGVLRDYYGGASAAFLQGSMSAAMRQPAKPEKFKKAEGAGGSIIDILEVVESDFAKSLSNEEMEEADSLSAYEKQTQENAITKTTKMQDVKYKTIEFISLDKEIAQWTKDRKSTQTELDAVNEYYAKVKDKCIAKPESYEERKKKRANEIAGLKEALNILENQVAFMQQRKRGSKSGGFLGH